MENFLSPSSAVRLQTSTIAKGCDLDPAASHMMNFLTKAPLGRMSKFIMGSLCLRIIKFFNVVNSTFHIKCLSNLDSGLISCPSCQKCAATAVNLKA